jgi:hypothetical protein
MSPQGDRGIGLGLPFNQTWPTLWKWSSAGSVKLKAASHNLESLNYSSFVTGSVRLLTVPAGHYLLVRVRSGMYNHLDLTQNLIFIFSTKNERKA